MKKSDIFNTATAIICIVTCIGEFVVMFVAGTYYPGYSQLKSTISSLGASSSPVSEAVSLWWIIMGILLIIFAIGFKRTFSEKPKYSTIGSWLIILYGLGEGLGSGLFKADHISEGLSTSLIVHDTVGGIGVAAILIFPLIMQKLITKIEMPVFYRFSKIAFVCGIFTILFFLFRYLPNQNSFLAIYKGLWQRLFMLNTYVYLIVVSVISIKKQFHHNNN